MRRIPGFLLILFMLGGLQLHAQFKIREVDEEDLRDGPSGTLSLNELLVQCRVSPNFTIEYSVDKRHWVSRKMSYKRIIEVKLDDEYAYFFVRICDATGSEVNCRNIKLTPGRRYALVRDQDTNVVKLVTSKS